MPVSNSEQVVVGQQYGENIQTQLIASGRVGCEETYYPAGPEGINFDVADVHFVISGKKPKDIVVDYLVGHTGLHIGTMSSTGKNPVCLAT